MATQTMLINAVNEFELGDNNVAIVGHNMDFAMGHLRREFLALTDQPLERVRHDTYQHPNGNRVKFISAQNLDWKYLGLLWTVFVDHHVPMDFWETRVLTAGVCSKDVRYWLESIINRQTSLDQARQFTNKLLAELVNH